MINPILEFKFNQSALVKGPEGSFHMTWQVPSDLSYFDGHFPQEPIFPAVGIIDASIEIIQLSQNSQALSLKEVSAGKFFRPITPSMTVEISLAPKQNGRWKIQWKESGSLLVDLDLRLSSEITN